MKNHPAVPTDQEVPTSRPGIDDLPPVNPRPLSESELVDYYKRALDIVSSIESGLQSSGVPGLKDPLKRGLTLAIASGLEARDAKIPLYPADPKNAATANWFTKRLDSEGKFPAAVKNDTEKSFTDFLNFVVGIQVYKRLSPPGRTPTPENVVCGLVREFRDTGLYDVRPGDALHIAAPERISNEQYRKMYCPVCTTPAEIKNGFCPRP